jgi:hypothetical protein
MGVGDNTRLRPKGSGIEAKRDIAQGKGIEAKKKIPPY